MPIIRLPPRGTIGVDSSSSAPMKYSGHGGPGTLVTTRSVTVWWWIARLSRASSPAGTTSTPCRRTSAPATCSWSLMACMRSRTGRRRRSGLVADQRELDQDR